MEMLDQTQSFYSIIKIIMHEHLVAANSDQNWETKFYHLAVFVMRH